MRFFYITLLILGAIPLAPNLAFADMPSECPGVIEDYNVIVDGDGTSEDDFITISDDNSTNIDGKGGNDCIVVGADNSGKIEGSGGDDVIIISNNNSGNILSGTGADKITVGSGNSGRVEGNGSNDVLVIGNNNAGFIMGGAETDSISVGDNNSGKVEGNGGADTILVGVDNSGGVSGGTETDNITIGDNNSGKVESEGGDDIINIGNNNNGPVQGGTGIDIITIGNDNGVDGDVELNGGDDILKVGERNRGNITGGTGDDTAIHGYGNTGVVDVENVIAIPPAPSASPLPGTFNSIQNITLSSDGAESIFYTIDSTIPDCEEENRMLYEEPVPVLSTKTITAIACTEDGEYSSPVASFAYTIELKIDQADLSSILEAVFVPAPDTSLSLTSSLTVSQDLEINATASGSKIVLSEATIITRADEQEFDAATLVSSETDIGLLSGLTEGQVFEGALQWGIPSITLEFNPAITISIFVGTDLNGQTLSVVRSATGTDSWTDDGIVSPATCVVSAGICSFQAIKASYYAIYTYTPPAPQPSNSGGGGGTIWFPALYAPASTPAPETISTPVAPVLAPEPTPASTLVVVAVVPKKVVQAKISKVQPTQELTKIKIVEQPTVKKNLLSNIFTVILGLFRWPF
ncbi:MAG: chitobiase/beta-hexosaminidase C-terminal domain-containing protein [Candidatus Yanofskybacteria bacterium]|nr:chitobiase/beta-hexosaminidase C-terminal domain-containing protein [Candidatus Yanofskybacteria bacterium]